MTVDYTSLLLALATSFRFIGIVILCISVLPIQYQEARVKDGLSFLRWGILTGTCIYLFLQILGFTSFITNPKEVDYILKLVRANAYFNFLSLINSLGIFVISLILHFIYHRHYEEPYL